MKFFIGLLFFALALILQFWFASAGIAIDFLFAALIGCAFVLDFLDMLFFVLLAVFIVNWQPAVSLTIILFALLPLAACVFHKLFPWWHGWVGTLVAVIAGLSILYLSVSPMLLFANWRSFSLDLFASVVFGSLVYFGMEKTVRR